MRKIIPLAVLLLFLGAGLAGAQETERIQLLDNRYLNSIYAVDGQRNYIGFMFSEDETQLYGNTESFADLQRNSTEVCEQYVKRGGFLQGQQTSQIECNPLTTERPDENSTGVVRTSGQEKQNG